MKHSVMTLMLAAFAVSAVAFTQSEGRTEVLRYPTGTNVEILVNGSPQPRYAHDGRWYVEALKGKEYAIRLRNPYPVRAAVALSVDGLNTIDAQHTAAADARKWVLDPHETVTISGWQISRAEARRFEFTTESNSYAQALGKAANLGVISAVFYKERTAITTRQERAPSAVPVPVPGSGSGSQESADASSARRLSNDYAATGMGQRTDHAVTQVWLDLENTPAQTVNIRYECRAQLVKLGILPAHSHIDPLARRERARGFEPGFAPEVPLR